MRILLVTEDVPAAMLGGAGQHAVVLGNALLAQGHDVHLLGYRHGSPAPEESEPCGFLGSLHLDINFSGARWQEQRLGIFSPLARPHMARRLWAAIRSLPGPWDVVHYHGHNAMLGNLIPTSWNFVQTLHDQGAECITMSRLRQGQPCRETRAQACAGCAAKRPNPAQRWFSTQAVRALRQGSFTSFQRHKVVFVSEFVRHRYLAMLGITTSDIRSEVVHNFVDPQKLQAALLNDPAPWPSEPHRLRVFAAGRIDQAKGFSSLLQVLDDTMLQRLDLVIAGDGPELAHLREQHAGRGVRFLGWCQPATVLAWTRAAQVCVVPSIWEEPCATTVLEALALGRPVLALRRGGTPELARYARAGQLRLFDELHELVLALGEAQFAPTPYNPSAVVNQRLPELLAVYNHPVTEDEVQKRALERFS